MLRIISSVPNVPRCSTTTSMPPPRTIQASVWEEKAACCSVSTVRVLSHAGSATLRLVDFSIPDDLRQLLSSFRSFLDREVRPVEERYAERLQLDDLDPELLQAGLALRRRSAELGYYAAHMPPD